MLRTYNSVIVCRLTVKFGLTFCYLTCINYSISKRVSSNWSDNINKNCHSCRMLWYYMYIYSSASFNPNFPLGSWSFFLNFYFWYLFFKRSLTEKTVTFIYQRYELHIRLTTLHLFVIQYYAYGQTCHYVCTGILTYIYNYRYSRWIGNLWRSDWRNLSCKINFNLII